MLTPAMIRATCGECGSGAPDVMRWAPGGGEKSRVLCRAHAQEWGEKLGQSVEVDAGYGPDARDTTPKADP
jgi:hypothetical protein